MAFLRRSCYRILDSRLKKVFSRREFFGTSVIVPKERMVTCGVSAPGRHRSLRGKWKVNLKFSWKLATAKHCCSDAVVRIHNEFMVEWIRALPPVLIWGWNFPEFTMSLFNLPWIPCTYWTGGNCAAGTDATDTAAAAAAAVEDAASATATTKGLANSEPMTQARHEFLES